MPHPAQHRPWVGDSAPLLRRPPHNIPPLKDRTRPPDGKEFPEVYQSHQREPEAPRNRAGAGQLPRQEHQAGHPSTPCSPSPQEDRHSASKHPQSTPPTLAPGLPRCAETDTLSTQFPNTAVCSAPTAGEPGRFSSPGETPAISEKTLGKRDSYSLSLNLQNEVNTGTLIKDHKDHVNEVQSSTWPMIFKKWQILERPAEQPSHSWGTGLTDTTSPHTGSRLMASQDARQKSQMHTLYLHVANSYASFKTLLR